MIDDLIIIQDDLGLTNKNESHSMYGKNLHASDKSLVTEFVFINCVDAIILTESVTSCHRRHDLDIRNYNFKYKDKGHLVLQPTQFELIGPDREVVLIKNADQYLDIARVVLSTGQTNYKQACIPIKVWPQLRGLGK